VLHPHPGAVERMKSILIACHAWHGEYFGGAFKLAAEFAQYLSAKGHDVHFLCGTERSAFINPTLENGLKIWRYRFPKAPAPSPANLMGHILGAWRLTKRIGQIADISFLNGHSPLQFLGAVLALRRHPCRKTYSVHSPFVEELRSIWGAEKVIAARIRPLKFLFSAHDFPSPPFCTGAQHESVDSPPFFKGGRGGFQNTFRSRDFPVRRRLALATFAFLEHQIYRLSDAIQCDSEYSLAVIKQQYPGAVGSRGLVCPGWVDLDRFQLKPDKDEVRKSLGVPWVPGLPTFLCVRRLERRMGLDHLIRACAILASQGHRFSLIIGGIGPLRKELEADIAERHLRGMVHMVGGISEEQLPLYYTAADCFVLPTRSLECFGLIVLEAFACGAPVIATPVGSIPEVMGKTFRSCLTEDTSAISLADCMRRFLCAKLKFEREVLRSLAERYCFSVVLERLDKVVLGSSV